jgi:AcrR family transcriptional regulator
VKPPLSRDAIVTEALEELTRDGLAGLSLRKVAAALDTGPASLYAYVDNLQELQALVLDRALASVDLRGARKKTGWRNRLVSVLESYLRVLFRSSGLAQLAFGTVAVGPNALRIMETLLGLLEEAGVGRANAAFGVDLLVLYVTATAAEHSDGRDPANPEGSAARAIRGVAAHDYPRIHAAREDLLAGTGGERFAWAIDVLLSGILETSKKRSRTTKGPRARRR